MNKPQQGESVRDAVWKHFAERDFHATLALAHGRREPGYRMLCAIAYEKLGNIERSIACCRDVLANSTDRYEQMIVRMYHDFYIGDDEHVARATVAEGLAFSRETGDTHIAVYCYGNLIRLDTVASGAMPDDTDLRSALTRAKRDVARARPWYTSKAEWVWSGALRALALAYGAAGDDERDLAVHLESLDIAVNARDIDFIDLAVNSDNLAWFLRSFPLPKVRARVERALQRLPAKYENRSVERARRGLLVNTMIFGRAGAESPLQVPSTDTIRERAFTIADALLFGGSRNQREFDAAVRDLRDLSARSGWFPNDPGDSDAVFASLALAPHDLDAAKAREMVAPRAMLLDRGVARADEHHRSAPLDLLRGVTLKARGEFDAARESLTAALAQARRFRMMPTASIAGIERFTLSRDQGDLRDAQTFVGEHADSWMSRRVRTALARAESSDAGDFPYLRHGC